MTQVGVIKCFDLSPIWPMLADLVRDGLLREGVGCEGGRNYLEMGASCNDNPISGSSSADTCSTKGGPAVPPVSVPLHCQSLFVHL